MKVDRNDVWTGLFTLAAIATFVVLMFLANAQKVTANTYPIKVRLETLRGVAPGTEVTLLGLSVGLVDSVDLVQRGVDIHGLAVLNISADTPLWDGSSAAIVPRGVWGSVIELELPPPEKRKRKLRPWATLQGRQGQSLETLVAQAEITLESFQGAADALRQTTMQGVLEAPAVKDLLSTIESTVRQYETLGREARGIVKQSGHSLGSLDQTLGSMRTSLDHLDGMLARREPDLQKALEAVPRTLKDAQAMMVELRTATSELKPATKTTFVRLERVLRDMEELVELLKQKPSRVVWGKPSEEERERAKRAVQAPAQ
jgi:ABC-type transporter Mla subunit MlaD